MRLEVSLEKVPAVLMKIIEWGIDVKVCQQTDPDGSVSDTVVLEVEASEPVVAQALARDLTCRYELEEFNK